MLTTPATFNLDQDVLWRIFSSIARSRPGPDDSMEFRTTQELETAMEMHSLTVIRNISQVCFKWRRLVIDSSSIWGEMIDVEIMGRMSESWRSTIMSRTKEATLCVYGHVCGDHDATRNFFSILLTNEWHRIAELDVVISSCDKFDNHLWTTFWDQPAGVHLNSFSVAFNVFHRSLSETLGIRQKGRVLFEGYAPSLKSLHATQLDVSPHASWISGLTDLTLSSHFSASQILDILCRIPFLTFLNIDGQGCHVHDINDVRAHAYSPTLPGPCRQVMLPNLRKLKINATFRKCSSLISYIGLPQDALCEVTIISGTYISGTYRRKPHQISLEDIESFILGLISLTQHFLQCYQVTGIDIRMTSISFYVAFDRPLHPGNIPPPHIATINIFTQARFPPTSLSQLMEAMSSCDLSAVTKLTTTLTRWDGIDPTDPSFHSLLLALSGVETLIVPQDSVQLLNGVDLEFSTIFPSLKTLILNFRLPRKAYIRLNRSIELFLSRRSNAGNPVAVLDIYKFAASDEVISREFLESIQNLHGI